MERTTQIADEGYANTTAVFETMTLRRLAALETRQTPRSRAGVRHAMSHPAVANVAKSRNLLEIAAAALNDNAVPFRAMLIDKSPNSNWLVARQQDPALPLKERRETYGWGPWSLKAGVVYAHAPGRVLDKVVERWLLFAFL